MKRIQTKKQENDIRDRKKRQNIVVKQEIYIYIYCIYRNSYWSFSSYHLSPTLSSMNLIPNFLFPPVHSLFPLLSPPSPCHSFYSFFTILCLLSLLQSILIFDIYGIVCVYIFGICVRYCIMVSSRVWKCECIRTFPCVCSHVWVRACLYCTVGVSPLSWGWVERECIYMPVNIIIRLTQTDILTGTVMFFRGTLCPPQAPNPLMPHLNNTKGWSSITQTEGRRGRPLGLYFSIMSVYSLSIRLSVWFCTYAFSFTSTVKRHLCCLKVLCKPLSHPYCPIYYHSTSM